MMTRMNESAAETTAEVVEAVPVPDEPGVPDPRELGLELPDDADEAIGLLLSELMTARSEADSYVDDLKRVAADFDNYRKRTRKESEVMLDRATEKVVVSLMPALDSFDAALANEPDPDSDAERQMYSGLLNTREQLLTALKSQGLEAIPTVGEKFDPEVHEPVGAPTGDGQLVVSQELRRGYLLNGKVLRAALVVLEVD